MTRPGSTERKPRRNRLGLFALIALASGAVAGIVAFGNLQTLATQITGPDRSVAFAAHTLFPPVPPVKKLVEVYDPAPAGGGHAPVAQAPGAPPRATGAPPRATGAPPSAPPTGTPTSQPTPTSPPTPPADVAPTIVFPTTSMAAIEATCEQWKAAAQGHSAAYQQSVERQCEAAKQAYEKAHP